MTEHSASKGATGSPRAFSADPEHSYTLPPTYYYDSRIYEREREQIFYRSWQYVGHVDQLERPGDYIVGTVLDQKIIVVRADDGALKAFFNICSHRGHLLASCNGHATRLVCPFHAWTYDLTGALRSAPNAKNVADFDYQEHSLVEVRVEQFLNLIMVNLDRSARPLADMVSGLEAEILAFLPDIGHFKLARTDTFPLKCNWKFVFDQLECYHCPVLHPEAAVSVDFSARKTTEHEWYHSAVSYLAPRNSRDLLILRANPGDAIPENHVWCLWPNYMLLGQPGPGNMSLVEAVPAGPDNVAVLVHHFFPTGSPSEENLRQMNVLRDVVFPQDLSAVESQQNGVRCRGYRPGRLMVDAKRSYLGEHPTHWFDKKVWEIHRVHET